MTIEAPTNDPTDALERRAIAWLFGDDDEDPGLIADEASRQAGFVPWLDGFVSKYKSLKGAIGSSASELVVARGDALREDIARRSSGGVDWAGARRDNVRSLTAAPKRARSWWLGGAVVLAAAAVLLLTLGRGSSPGIDAATATALVAELAPDGGFGFAGAAPPTARDRGFLLGAVIDLSRPRRDGQKPGEPERELALSLADRALKGLDAPVDAEAQRQRVIGGCAAILVDPKDRSACERGLADYIARRDALTSK